MNRRIPGWLAAMTALALIAAAPAWSQQKEDELLKQPDSSAVEDILRENEEALSGQHFTYDPAGRRDPFRSLLEAVRTSKGGKRPPGIQGMLVAEIDLAGIVEDRAGDLGLLIGSDNKGYFLHVGDPVFDGTVIAIDPRLGTVTFRQEIDDPRMIKPYRDVVKRLVPLDHEESADE